MFSVAIGREAGRLDERESNRKLPKKVSLPMKKRRRLIVVIGLMVGFALAFIIPDSRWAIVGLLRNESFYRSKPTSYWRKVYVEGHASTRPFSSRWEKSWLTTVISYSTISDPESDLQGLVGGDDSQAVPVLIELLKDEEAIIRHGAGYALGRRKSKAKAAVPFLLEAYTKKKSPEDVAMAARALYRSDPETAKREGVVQPLDPPVLAPGEGAEPFMP